MSSIFAQQNAALGAIDGKLQEGQEFNLRGMTLPHFPVKDTALAACLATLGIPLREPAPYTDDVALDALGNEVGRTTVWWLGDVSMEDCDWNGQPHKTEELLGAWIKRDRFRTDFPLHPLNCMREALDARSYWCRVIAAWRRGSAELPIEVNLVGNPTTSGRVACFATESLHGACVLKACGYLPLAFNGRSFFLPRVKDGVEAQQLLLQAALLEGASPAQWMARVLKNYSHMVDITKRQSVIVRERFDDQTLLLSADATPKTRRKFHGLL